VDEPSGVVMRCEARGFTFDVHGAAELEPMLTALFAALERPAGKATALFSVDRAAGDGTNWQVRVDGKLMMACEQRGEALHALLVFLNQRVVMAHDDLLSIHAAAVATQDGAVLLPGDAGSGKTTLCARLLQRGAGYLSDDSVALDRDGRVLGYPKPLGFKLGTWEQFADAGLADLELDPGTQLVWQVPPSRLGATSVAVAEPVAIALPRFERGASLRAEPISRQAAAAALLGQVQNLPAFGVPTALEVIGRLAARVPAHAVFYGDARHAAPAVLDLIRPVECSAGSYELVPAGIPVGTPSQPYPARDLTALCFDEGALLVRGESGKFITVDRAGAVIWPLLDGHRTVEAIGAELAPVFDADRREVEADIAGWIGELLEAGFLVSP
jgi:hypothetical protein